MLRLALNSSRVLATTRNRAVTIVQKDSACYIDPCTSQCLRAVVDFSAGICTTGDRQSPREKPKFKHKPMRRKKIIRDFPESEIERTAVLANQIQELEEHDLFGSLSADKENRIESDASIALKKTQWKKGVVNKGTRSDEFGNVDQMNLGDEEISSGYHKLDRKRYGPGQFGKGNDGELGTPHRFGNHFQDLTAPASVEVKESLDPGTDEFGLLADDFEDSYLRPGPITKANVRLRVDEASEANDDFHIRLSAIDRKHDQNWYERRIEKLAESGQVIEALEFLEDVMIGKDRVMPTAFAYTVIIDAMAKQGYPQGAFKLFRKMLVYKLKPFDQTYTALFNACANCPDKRIALRFAEKFRETLANKDILPNRTTYKAMMKVYALAGDLQTTFALADELYLKRGRIDHDSFSHMLMAAISDKEAGFKHAVEVFRSMQKHGLTPTITQYNLLLRAIRECDVGGRDLLRDLLGVDTLKILQAGKENNTPPQNQILELRNNIGSRENKGRESSNLTLRDKAKSDDEMIEKLSVESTLSKESTGTTDLLKSSSQLSKIPDILSPNPDTSNMLSVSEIKAPADRLELLGGTPGLLARMRRDGVSLDIKTLTLLLDVIPSTTAMEDLLISALEEFNIVPDAGFFNILMRKRVFRQDYSAARSVLDHFTGYRISPDIKTFGVLALTCQSKNEAFILLTDLQNVGLEPSSVIMAHLAKASYMDFEYKRSLCVYMKKQEIKPDEKFLQHMERSIVMAKKLIRLKEQGEKVPWYVRPERFASEFGQFMKQYKTWLMSMEMEVAEPYWKKFKDYERAKKDEKVQKQEEKKSVFLREVKEDLEAV